MREMNLQDLKAQTPAELGTFAEEKAVAAIPRPLLFCRFAVGGDETEPKFRSGILAAGAHDAAHGRTPDRALRLVWVHPDDER